MSSLLSVLENTVPFSSFNNNEGAERVFAEVKKYGAKVVIKNDTAECVLLSPSEYQALIDELEDMKLALIAEERLKNFDPKKVRKAEDVYKRLGITEKDLEGFDEVEIE